MMDSAQIWVPHAVGADSADGDLALRRRILEARSHTGRALCPSSLEYQEMIRAIGTGIFFPGLAAVRRDAGPKAAIFDFTTVSGFAAEWRADQLAYKDAGSTLCSDGDTVAQWNNTNGGGTLPFSEATNKPTFHTNMQNGLPGIQFTANNQKLISTVAMTRPLWIFMVGVQDSWANNGNILNSADFAIAPALQTPTTPTIRCYTGAVQGGDNADMAVGAWHILRFSGNVSNCKLRVDTNTATSTNALSVASIAGLQLGQNPGGGNAARFTLGHLLVYNATIGSTDEANILAGLKSIWNTP